MITQSYDKNKHWVYTTIDLYQQTRYIRLFYNLKSVRNMFAFMLVTSSALPSSDEH